MGPRTAGTLSESIASHLAYADHLLGEAIHPHAPVLDLAHCLIGGSRAVAVEAACVMNHTAVNCGEMRENWLLNEARNPARLCVRRLNSSSSSGNGEAHPSEVAAYTSVAMRRHGTQIVDQLGWIPWTDIAIQELVRWKSGESLGHVLMAACPHMPPSDPLLIQRGDAAASLLLARDLHGEPCWGLHLAQGLADAARKVACDRSEAWLGAIDEVVYSRDRRGEKTVSILDCPPGLGPPTNRVVNYAGHLLELLSQIPLPTATIVQAIDTDMINLWNATASELSQLSVGALAHLRNGTLAWISRRR